MSKKRTVCDLSGLNVEDGVVTASVDNLIIDKIAAIVGYKGESMDELLEDIEATVATASRHDGRDKPSYDVLTALGLPHNTESWGVLEYAAIQIAATLDDSKWDLSKAVAQVASLEQERLSIMLACGDSIHPEKDLITNIESLVASRKWDREYIKRLESQIDRMERVKSTSKDSILLDLSMMVIRGDVVGVGAGLIGAIREAA